MLQVFDFLLLVNVAYGWGTLGHQVTGLIAQSFLTPRAQSFLEIVLPEYAGRLESFTSWADSVKFTKPWSRKHHYVNAAPSRASEGCSFDPQAHCRNGNCVVAAIQNYTTRATCQAVGGNPALAAEPVLFLSHYVGDITQPLHVCARENGGNGAKARFNSRSGAHNTDLHSGLLCVYAVWDSKILTKRLREFSKDTSQYAQALINEINYGSYKEYAQSWTFGITRDFYSVDRNGFWAVAVDWTRDSNMFDCTTVWPLYDMDPEQDLAMDYYHVNVPVVDVQLAKAGLRLAALINRIVDTYSMDGTCKY